MEAKIDYNGYIQVKRNGTYKDQGCRYGEDTYCGDWCPLFYEDINQVSSEPYHYVRICCGYPVPSYRITKDERVTK